MRSHEKRMVLLLAALLGVAILLEGVPRAWGLYQQQREAITQLEQRVERYRQLADETARWQQRERDMQAMVADYGSWVLEGDNPGLAGSSVQRLLRQAVAASGISLREMSVARVTTHGEWLAISQDMSFSLEEPQVLAFLAALEALRPRLFITAFSLSHNRRQYLGSVTVTGFSRKPRVNP